MNHGPTCGAHAGRPGNCRGPERPVRTARDAFFLQHRLSMVEDRFSDLTSFLPAAPAAHRLRRAPLVLQRGHHGRLVQRALDRGFWSTCARGRAWAHSSWRGYRGFASAFLRRSCKSCALTASAWNSAVAFALAAAWAALASAPWPLLSRSRRIVGGRYVGSYRFGCGFACRFCLDGFGSLSGGLGCLFGGITLLFLTRLIFGILLFTQAAFFRQFFFLAAQQFAWRLALLHGEPSSASSIDGDCGSAVLEPALQLIEPHHA